MLCTGNKVVTKIASVLKKLTTKKEIKTNSAIRVSNPVLV